MDQIKTAMNSCYSSLLHTTDDRAELKKFVKSSNEKSLPELIDKIRQGVQQESNQSELVAIRKNVRLIRATMENHNPIALWISSVVRSLVRLFRSTTPEITLSFDKCVPKLKDLEAELDQKITKPTIPVKISNRAASNGLLLKLAPPSADKTMKIPDQLADLSSKEYGMELTPKSRLDGLNYLMDRVQNHDKDDLLAKEIIKTFEKPNFSLKGTNNYKDYALILLQAELDTMKDYTTKHENFQKVRGCYLIHDIMTRVNNEHAMESLTVLQKLDFDNPDKSLNELADVLKNSSENSFNRDQRHLSAYGESLAKHKFIHDQNPPNFIKHRRVHSNELKLTLMLLTKEQIVDFFIKNPNASRDNVDNDFLAYAFPLIDLSKYKPFPD